MTNRALLGVPLLLLALFGAGVAAGRAAPQPSPVPVAEPAGVSVTAAADRTCEACKRSLADAQNKLAICQASRPPPDSSDAASPPSKPPPDVDEETARLLSTHTTNATTVTVDLPPCGFRSYQPGKWPPADGVPAGARLIARHVDGGVEWYRDGGTQFIPVPTNHRISCPPCPSCTGGEGGAPP